MPFGVLWIHVSIVPGCVSFAILLRALGGISSVEVKWEAARRAMALTKKSTVKLFGIHRAGSLPHLALLGLTWWSSPMSLCCTIVAMLLLVQQYLRTTKKILRWDKELQVRQRRPGVDYVVNVVVEECHHFVQVVVVEMLSFWTVLLLWKWYCFGKARA